MVDRFQLTPAENERVYNESIEPAFFASTTAVSNPTIIIIAGQTGAGKSNLVQAAKVELHGNAVFINTDELRPFHPEIDEINRLGDQRSAERTHHDAALWKDRLLQRSAETHRNIIWEGVFRETDQLLISIAMLKDRGYRVIVRFIATHERFSMLGIHLRYESVKAKSGYGRFVPVNYHNECYHALTDAAVQVERQRMADVVEVYDRSGECLYRNELADDSWEHPEGARAAIETERSRPLSANERSTYRKSWNNLLEYMRRRKASAAEIAKVEQWIKHYCDET